MLRLHVAANDLRFMIRSLAFRLALLGSIAVTGAVAMTTTVTPTLDVLAASSMPALAAFRIILAVVIPWMVARQLSIDRGDRLVELVANASLHPSSMIEGKMLAAAIWSGLVVTMSAPPLVVAWSSSQVGTTSLVSPGLRLVGTALLAIVLTTHLCVLASARLRSWILSTAASLAALLALQILERTAGDAWALVAALAALAALIAWLRVRADAVLWSTAG
jgi:hypothetical protein